MNTADVISYEAMAKLDLPENERQWVAQKATELKKSFEALEEIDTQGVLPLVTVLDMKTVLREDKASKMMSRDEVLANAPEQYDGYFQVPRTLE